MPVSIFTPTDRAALAVAVDTVKAALTMSTATYRACSMRVSIFYSHGQSNFGPKKSICTYLEQTAKCVKRSFLCARASYKVFTPQRIIS